MNEKKYFVLYVGDDEEGFDEYASSNNIEDLYKIIEDENLSFDEYKLIEEDVF